MVYSNRFVICVMLKGEPVKERANGEVQIPFNSEYALRLRNKNNRRAVAKIYIDGENVSGGGYVIGANDHVDIRRHHDKDRAFKFVSLDSAEAVDFGKNGPNPDKIKGTIEVQFHLEKERPTYHYLPIIHDHHHHHHHYPKPTPQPWYPNPTYPQVWCSNNSGTYGSGGADMCSLGGIQMNAATPRGMSCSAGAFETMKLADSAPVNPTLQDGCTVEGYSTGQNFYTTDIEYEDTYTTLKLFLQGFQPREPVAEAPRRATNKDRHLDDLERENEELRRKLAELENQRLKDKLNELSK